MALNIRQFDGTIGFRLDGGDAYDLSGWSVSGAGDVNGDGIDDLIIGAPNRTFGARFGVGESYVVFGSAGGFGAGFDLSKLDGANGFRLIGTTDIDASGWSVSGAGDINGDGFDEIIIGAPSFFGSSGASYVLFGSDGGFEASLDLAALDGTSGFHIDGLNDTISVHRLRALGTSTATVSMI